MTNWAEQRDAAQRGRVLAQEIVDRHADAECEAVWVKHLVGMGARGNFTARVYVNMRKALPVQMAELLEPGELKRLMDETRKDAT